jgi:serine/threonine protein kinase
MPIVAGETVGAYRILEQLGQGGMATVFKAYHAALDRYVAIKALHPAFKEDDNFLARFQREARVVAKLDHPNIVPIYDFAEHEGRPYLVMKYIEGETLKARLGRKPLSITEIKGIVDAVGAALTYAHRRGVLHRDVKPSNVLLAKDGQIYLADFGLARIAAAGESTISSDMMLGTPQYISPEQALGKRDLDEGTDIYSFGVLLYELVVGQVPFSADTPYAIIYGHISAPLPLPRTINPKVTEDTERVLLKALAKERPDRYPTVSALVEAFLDAIGGMEGLPPKVKPEETKINAVPAVVTGIHTPLASEIAVPLDVPSADEVASRAMEIDPSSRTIVAKPTPARQSVIKKWYFWLAMIAVVFAIFLVIWFGLGLVRNNRLMVKKDAPVDSPVPQEAKVPLDAIKAARRRMELNINDPNSHLDLAIILIDARQFSDVPNELSKVDELVKEYGFYFDNGKKFVEQQKWIAATWAFWRFMALAPDPKPGELHDLWHESVYKAFREPDAGLVLDVNRIQIVDPAIAGVARAQADLSVGKIAQAEVDILATLKQYDNYTEALLVQARVLAMRNFPERAKNILLNLEQTDLPPWIRNEIIEIRESQNLKP